MRNQIVLPFMMMAFAACTQTPTVEQQVVDEIHTNPEVSQRAVTNKNSEIKPDAPNYRPIRTEYVESIHVPNGSLFNAENASSLYKLHKNYRVGDMILVQLDESTTSKKSLDYKSDKSSNFDLGPLSVNAGPIQIDEGDVAIGHSQENDFDASSESKQSNSLSGDITVYVMEILPNRNLIVGGEKWITLNSGEEYVRFSGEIRTSDIDASNSIISSKVGNARIEYSGKGQLHQNQEDSMLDKLFTVFK